MYVYVAILLAGLAAGFTTGWKTQDWRHGAAEAERQKIAARDLAKKFARVDEAAEAHENFKAKEEVVYVDRIKTVNKIVERPVYAAQCWDADGLRELNAAIAGGASPSQPAPAVSGSAKPAR